MAEVPTQDDGQVLPQHMGGGPRGLGDPEDRTLRRVEVDVLIPKKMRDKAKAGPCKPEVEAFTQCCKDNSLGMVLLCRKENTALKSCLGKWYENAEFRNQCTEEYLKERSEYRATGVKQSAKRKPSESF